jgi:starvation-inducible DNA-binding protein
MANPALENPVPKSLQTPNTMLADAVVAVSGALNALLADTFALYVKTKSFHWHVSGPHFRDYHELFDEQAAQILGMTDGIAERVRKIGGGTIRSIAHIGRLQRVKNNDEAFVPPGDMLRELMEDNKALAAAMRQAHDVCGAHRDVASTSLLENWIDEAEKRAWFLFEASRPATH